MMGSHILALLNRLYRGQFFLSTIRSPYSMENFPFHLEIHCKVCFSYQKLMSISLKSLKKGWGGNHARASSLKPLSFTTHLEKVPCKKNYSTRAQNTDILRGRACFKWICRNIYSFFPCYILYCWWENKLTKMLLLLEKHCSSLAE